MWLPGHLALAFLIAIPVFAWVQRKNEIRTPVILVIFFAAFPDFFHIGDLRAVSHSLIGLAGLMLVALLILSAFVKLNRWTILASVVGASSHLLGDTYIGHIYPQFPFSNAVLEFNEFNTLFDFQTELALSLLALLAIPVILYWDRKRRWGGRTGKERRFLLLMTLLLIAMAFAELVLFTQMNLGRNPPRSVLLMMPLFAGPLLLTLGWIDLRRLIQSLLKSKEKTPKIDFGH